MVKSESGENMLLDLYKRPEESDLEYQFRISSRKDEIGTWEDVANIINDNLDVEYGESKYRKDYTVFQKMLDAYTKINTNSDDHLKALEEAASELRKERIKLNATKAELNRNERYEARTELFYENLREAFDRLPLPDLYELPVSKNSTEIVLTIADLHYGAKFWSENNEYSREICRDRLCHLLGEMESISHTGVSKIKVLNLGDTLQGILRMKDLQLNDIPVVEATVEVSRLLASFLNELSKNFEVDYYHCTSSNHTQIRPLGTKANELSSEDLEKVIVGNIETALMDNERVTINYDFGSSYLPFKIMNFNCIAMHGNQTKLRGRNLMDGLSNLHGTSYDYVFMGHDHSEKVETCYEGATYNRKVFTCPAFIGSDPYSDSLFVGCRPGASILTFDEYKGHIMTYNIIFNEN